MVDCRVAALLAETEARDELGFEGREFFTDNNPYSFSVNSKIIVCKNAAKPWDLIPFNFLMSGFTIVLKALR